MNDKYIDLIDPVHVKPYLDWKSGQYKWGDEAYGTHQPVLIHLINETKGGVIEFGMGVYSTPLIHNLCDLQKRYALSVETDREWYNKFQQYKCLLIEPERINEYSFIKREYSVALIDGNPLKFRQTFINIMKDKVDYFVVHDSEVGQHDELYDYDFSGFKNIYEFKDILPHTCVLSNKKIPMWTKSNF